MKTITIKQPWASLIVEGIKDIENRTWPTKFRGRVLIHVSAMEVKGTMQEIYTEKQRHKLTHLALNHGFRFRENTKITSAIIGSIEIVECVINHSSVWAEKSYDAYVEGQKEPIKSVKVYNWVLANPILFDTPITGVKGSLGFWNYELPEGSYKCTNDNPFVHQGTGERQGCIQNCDDCDFYKSEYEIL